MISACINSVFRSNSLTLGEIYNRLYLLRDQLDQHIEELIYWLETCGVPDTETWPVIYDQSDDEWLDEDLSDEDLSDDEWLDAA